MSAFSGRLNQKVMDILLMKQPLLCIWKTESYTFFCSPVLSKEKPPRNLKELLQSFVDHRHDVVIRRTKFQLGKAQEKAHILQGLIIASQNIDEVIHIIRSSANTEEAKARLKEQK